MGRLQPYLKTLGLDKEVETLQLILVFHQKQRKKFYNSFQCYELTSYFLVNDEETNKLEFCLIFTSKRTEHSLVGRLQPYLQALE